MIEDDGPESEGEFGQFLQEEGIMAWLTDSPDPGEEVEETPADTEAAVERPRDEQGRFTKAEQEETPDEEVAAEEESAPETTEEQPEETADEDEDIVLEIDEDLQAVLDKYDGDVTKALRALGESQSMIGRQGNELGELRAQLNEMKQLMEQGFTQRPQQPQFISPYVNDIDDNPQGLVMEALERGDVPTVERALRAWGEFEPFEAATFLMTLQQQAAAQSAAVAPAPTESTTPQGPTIEAAMSEVVSRHPDVEKYLPQVEQVAQEFPTLRDSMRSGNPAAQAQAFEELLKIAKARSQGSDTQAAMKRIVLKTQEEVRKEKADAAVVSAKHQSAATSKSNVDAFLEAFEEATGQDYEGDWITRSNL
jgi:hypothetical protein